MAATPSEPPVLAPPETEAAIPPEETATCFGILKQGGLIICPAEPGSLVEFGETKLIAGETGTAQYGLPRTMPAEIDVRRGGVSIPLAIAPREDELRVVPGFDCDKIDARTPAQKAHAADSWTKKEAGFASLNTGRGALDGFILPADAPPSSPFGPTRKYVGVSKTSGKPCESMSVHQGFDLAAPVGTPVIAPADGIVTLADPDLYYEGGTIFLDHGHGLLSVFMHLSAVDVAAGDEVKRGDLIAKTGNTGRSTGPHLHWAVKWRNPDTENRGGDYYIDPALLLDLPVKD
ncbi:M23 family metallopeptidase [Hyphomonas sp.]|uniref:M23 family metallopeptidase n=1 Tax=Hyphomonas sp. TaxID=87 RepID=UPI0025C17749|nr:M23 family metallopeptidase [Hyphomonas sp.]